MESSGPSPWQHCCLKLGSVSCKNAPFTEKKRCSHPLTLPPDISPAPFVSRFAGSISTTSLFITPAFFMAALGLAVAVLCPSPQASAFGIRLGPLLLFGGRAHHHHRHIVRRPTEAVRRPTEALRRPTEGPHPNTQSRTESLEP